MKTKIRQKIANLSAEAEQLVSIRDNLSQQLSEVKTRLTQIVGAIKELDQLLNEEDNNEEKTVSDDSSADKKS